MSLAVGARHGAHEIVGFVGAGGLGEDYRARDTRLDRVVAIKVLLETLAADPHLRERIDREAHAVSALAHPHICTLYDIGGHNGQPFLIMELFDGTTLKQSIPGNRTVFHIRTDHHDGRRSISQLERLLPVVSANWCQTPGDLFLSRRACRASGWVRTARGALRVLCMRTVLTVERNEEQL